MQDIPLNSEPWLPSTIKPKPQRPETLHSELCHALRSPHLKFNLTATLREKRAKTLMVSLRSTV